MKNETKTKSIWHILSTENGKVRNKAYVFNDINYDNKVIHSPEKTPIIFKKYFINVTKNLIGCTSQYGNVERICLDRNSKFLEDVAVNEIIEVINTLKNKISAGEDNISNTHTKKLQNYIAKHLTFIINKSF